MTKLEMLVRAAAVMGLKVTVNLTRQETTITDANGVVSIWDPFENTGQAFELALTAGISVWLDKGRPVTPTAGLLWINGKPETAEADFIRQARHEIVEEAAWRYEVNRGK